MDDFKEKLIHLLHYPNITWNTVFQILKKDSKLSSSIPPPESPTIPSAKSFISAKSVFSQNQPIVSLQT